MSSFLLMDLFQGSLNDFAKVLADNGAGFDVAHSMDDALLALAGGNFSTVVVDLAPEGGNGPTSNGAVTLLNRLRKAQAEKTPALSAVRTVAITGELHLQGQEFILATAQSLGATWTFSRPLVAAEIKPLFDTLRITSPKRA